MLRSLKFLPVLVALLLLSGCYTDKALAPLPAATRTELARMGLSLGARLYVRAFKLENQMEVWLQNASGDYSLFRTYHICNWSGKLGPKLKEGDKQAPEGFYMVNASQMNPNSKYHLSFNLGFPNAFDRAHGYTGKHLMVHGGCKSVGCYAITDDAIQELFTLARESFAAGQRNFPVHAFPFRMTPERMAEHRGHKWYPFWQNLKQGYDGFEIMRRPPAVATAHNRYVFFTDENAVPDNFRLQLMTGDPDGPQMIAGWQN